jgi:hypothetical protein
VRSISNAVIELQGQLAATGVLEEARQRRAPINPYEKKLVRPTCTNPVPDWVHSPGNAPTEKCVPCEPEPLDKCIIRF